jgi:hypothetical protein
MKIICLSLFCCAALFLSSCSQATSKTQTNTSNKTAISEKPQEQASEKSKDYGEPKQIATLEDKEVNESSGIVASRINAGLFWTHNDSGDDPFLYNFDAEGKRRGVWRVAGAESRDWEDIAIGPGPQAGRVYIYIGDIGDNGREREFITIYRVSEPTIAPEDATATKSNPRQTEQAETIRLQYPDGKHDAETLLVHPKTGEIYVLTKYRDKLSGVYKLAGPASASSINKLVRVASVSVPSLFGGYLTGGEISPDGRRVILCDYLAAFEFALPKNAKFDDIWKEKPSTVSLGQRTQGESVCYSANGKAIYATSEKTPTPLIEVKRVK